MEVVSISNLSKCFKLYSGPKEKVKEWAHPFRKKYHEAFWALNDISFGINKGETLGIVGQNGSGKSTLLQIITRVMSPTGGTVNVKGRVAALLELGTGFDAELSGRENLYLNGSMMGLSKSEIQDRIPDIESFAAIGTYIDQPVKLYSSGMFVRLAFSAAIHVDPDILIIDEALAVGDIKFQNKCFRKFQEFKELGKTILFVTHSTDLVARHCDRALLIHQGCLIMDGEPNGVINRYHELLLGDYSSDANVDESDDTDDLQPTLDCHQNRQPSNLGKKSFLSNTSLQDRCSQNPTYNLNEHRYGNGKGKIIDYQVNADKIINPPRVEAHSIIEIIVRYHFIDAVNRPIYGLTLKTLDGVEIFGSNSLYEKTDIKPRNPGELSTVSFSLPMNLISGEYFISIGLAEFIDGEISALDRRYDMIHLVVYNPTSRSGVVDLNMQLVEVG